MLSEELRRLAKQCATGGNGTDAIPVGAALLVYLDAPASPSLEACVAEIKGSNAASVTQVGIDIVIDAIRRHWPTPREQATEQARHNFETWYRENKERCTGPTAPVSSPNLESCVPENEAKAAAFRAEQRNGDGKPEGTLESLSQCARMLDTYTPECFPANEQGQVHFARAIMESVADEINAFVANLPTAPAVRSKSTLEQAIAENQPVEPSEATALADQAERFAASLTTDECKRDWLNLARLLRSQRDEIAGLRKSEELYRKGMESQAELMDGLKQENRSQAAEIERLTTRENRWQLAVGQPLEALEAVVKQEQA